LNFSLIYDTGSHAELKHDMPNTRSGEVKSLGGVRTSHSSENGWFLALKNKILRHFMLSFRVVFT